MDLETKERIEKKKKEGGVMGHDPVSIKWKASDKFHKAGALSTVHRLQAEKLVKAEKAEYAKTKE